MSEANKDRRRVTLADVAERAKVSTSAVSRTFKPGGAPVAKKTKARVLKAAEELGFRPNILARSLMTGRSAMIALVSNAFENPYVMSILDAFTIELQNRNLRPVVFNLSHDYDRKEVVTLMAQYQIDGVLIASSTIDPAFIENVNKAQIPAVIAFGREVGQAPVSAAFVDNVEGGRMAARELVRRGYRRMGFIGAPETVSTSKDRLAGFREALHSEKLEPVAVAHGGDYSHEAGRKAAKKLLEAHPDIDALFCGDDLLGMGALDAIRFDLDRRVPETGVIGFNDIGMASWPAYDLTTFRTHTEQVVANAIDMLEAQIENGPRPRETRMTACELVVRGSLRALPADES